MYWKEASKFLMSKHQQVQLLEAAAILVGMESTASSLPEEKALWPVRPPHSPRRPSAPRRPACWAVTT